MALRLIFPRVLLRKFPHARHTDAGPRRATFTVFERSRVYHGLRRVILRALCLRLVLLVRDSLA